MARQKKAAAKTYKIRVSENAIKIGDTIFNTIDRIAENPFAFKECEELPTKNKIYRKAICKS